MPSMRNSFTILMIFVVLCGCERSSQSTPSTQSAPISIELGIYDDGTAFWDWEEVLQYKTMANGTLNSRCRIEGSFSRAGKNEYASLKVVAQIDAAGAYEVLGEYESNVPLTLILLGTGERPDENARYHFQSGKSAIRHLGIAPYSFDKQTKAAR